MMWFMNRPLGALGGYIDLHAWMRGPASGPGRREPGWRVFFLIGIVGGGLVSALLGLGGDRATLAYGSFDGRLGPTLPAKALVLAAAGALIGYGARTAGGCTSGHGLCGISFGSLGSVVATATFMGTAIAVTQVLAWFLGG
jgi:uncharacterized membrane protein YedE/YeeE